MQFITDELDDYCSRHTSDEPEILYHLNRETHLKVLQPRMLSGHFQGRLLSMLTKMIQPQRILEIGTYTGYSALCMLEGLREDGELITIDINEELEEIVRKYFKLGDPKKQIQYHIADARELISQLPGEFDLVFIDADKSAYPMYYDMLINRIKPGGYLLTDNVLWSGKVLEIVKENDEDTQAIIAFNEKVKNDPRVETILLPIRDGLMLTRKK